MGVAHTERYQKEGEWCNGKTVFIDVTLFGEEAERAKNELHKGTTVTIEGKIGFDQWDDKNTGARRSKHFIIAKSVDVVQRQPSQRQEPSQPDESEDVPW